MAVVAPKRVEKDNWILASYKHLRTFFKHLRKLVPKRWYQQAGFIVIAEVIYLFGLLTVGFFYINGHLTPFFSPVTLDPIPLAVPWFGALGGVVISLVGTVDHRDDWQERMYYWHLTRPFVGAVFAIIAVLIFKAGILAVGSHPNGANVNENLLYYLVAFLVGYREETFRELMKRLIDVLLTPGGSPPPPAMKDINPAHGAEGIEVTIDGSHFTGVTSVTFGPTAAKFRVDSDRHITATVPAGKIGKPVKVTVTSKTGSDTGSEFTYTPKNGSAKK